MLIGEIYLPVERLVAYYGATGKARSSRSLPADLHAWSAQDVSHIVDEYDAAVPDGCWPNWVLGNHDQSGSQPGWVLYAPMAAMLLLTCAARQRCITATNSDWRT